MDNQKNHSLSNITQQYIRSHSPVRKQKHEFFQTLALTASSKKFLEEQIFNNKQNKYTGCNCNRSQCLKMYCACFSQGKICDQTCLCQSCKNDADNMQRSQVIFEIISKDPYAFSKNTKQFYLTQCQCNCKKSGCQKKYCDCFKRGKKCGKTCQCSGCNNKNKQQQIIKQLNEGQKPKKQIKLQ